MQGFFAWVSESFSNREIAFSIWAIFILAILASGREIRSSMWSVTRALAHWKLALVFASVGAHTLFLVSMLTLFGLWTPEQLPHTILWYFLVGLPLSGRAILERRTEGFFSSVVRDSIAITVLIEFAANLESFGLLLELILLPIAVFFAVLVAVSDTDNELRKTKGFFEIALAIVGLIFIWRSASAVMADPTGTLTLSTLRDFALPVLLTIGSIPALFAWQSVAHMEAATIQLDQKTFHTQRVREYARERFLREFFFRPRLLRRAVRNFNLSSGLKTGDIDEIVQLVWDQSWYEANPPTVDPEVGWSPFLAAGFLAKQGLETDDYHSGLNDEDWRACSSEKYLNDDWPRSSASYCIEGERWAVKLLRLRGAFTTETKTDASLAQFRALCVSLVSEALGIETAEADALLPTDGPFELRSNGTNIKLEESRFPEGKFIDRNLTLDR